MIARRLSRQHGRRPGVARHAFFGIWSRRSGSRSRPSPREAASESSVCSSSASTALASSASSGLSTRSFTRRRCRSIRCRRLSYTPLPPRPAFPQGRANSARTVRLAHAADCNRNSDTSRDREPIEPQPNPIDTAHAAHHRSLPCPSPHHFVRNAPPAARRADRRRRIATIANTPSTVTGTKAFPLQLARLLFVKLQAAVDH
jgi:hypothetical protein